MRRIVLVLLVAGSFAAPAHARNDDDRGSGNANSKAGGTTTTSVATSNSASGSNGESGGAGKSDDAGKSESAGSPGKSDVAGKSDNPGKSDSAGASGKSDNLGKSDDAPIAESRNKAAVVSWSIPSDGGAAITTQIVRAYLGSRVVSTVSVDGTTSSVRVPRLRNGVEYTFTVQARNSVGAGRESAPSAPVRPAR